METHMANDDIANQTRKIDPPAFQLFKQEGGKKPKHEYVEFEGEDRCASNMQNNVETCWRRCGRGGLKRLDTKWLLAFLKHSSHL